jgi:two-component system response regulator
MSRNQVEILLVEDDPDDVELTLHALYKEKVCNRIEIARDGEEALDFIFCRGLYRDRPQSCQPKLILLDLKLSKVDGLEVLRLIKSDPDTKVIPVVILTSSRQEEDLIRGYELGVNSYIQKPVDFDRFRECIKQLGFYWLLVNQPPPAQAFPSLAGAGIDERREHNGA